MMERADMKQLYKMASLGVLLFGLGRGTSYGAFYTYEWEGDPGYSGTLVLDAQSSAGGSISDIMYLEVTTPDNGTLIADLNPANGDVQLIDPVFTWNAGQITEMGITAYVTADPNSPAFPDYLIAAQNFDGTGLNQLSGAAPTLSSPLFDEIDTGGNWVAAVPEPSSLAYCFGCAVPLGSIAFRAWRRKVRPGRAA
jgi:hypothetical protein